MTRRSRLWLCAGLALAGVLALAAGSAALYVTQLTRQFDENTTKIAEPFPHETLRPASPAPVPSADPAAETVTTPAVAQNILLLGTDTRGSLDATTDVNSRSDTMMVVHIPADRSGLTVMSIMRDSWVPIPDHGEAKVNAALSWGGAPLAVRTVESIIGVRIDHVVIVDFAGFGAIVDALGGVDVENAVAFSVAGQDYPRGTVHLDGTNALNFVRERYPFPDADYQRVRNQQAFMSAVAGRILTASSALDLGTIQRLVAAAAPHLAVDEGFSSAYIGQLAMELRGVTMDDVRFFTAPTTGTGTSSDGQSIVVLDAERMESVRQAFMSGTVTTLPPSMFQE